LSYTVGSVATVAVFDAEMPPAVAFARAAGRAGVRVIAYSRFRLAASRFSRHVSHFHHHARAHGEEWFVDWLCDEMDRREIDHVAPTSDAIVYALAEAQERTGRQLLLPKTEAVRDCLFKARFATAMAQTEIPTPPTAMPLTLDEALADAERLGYPLVLKPRSHVKIGGHRGHVVASPSELRLGFRPFPVEPSPYDVNLALPLLQHYVPPDAASVVSVTGFIDESGRALAVDHCEKLRQWPPRLGIGCLFRAVPPQPFTERALDAVQSVLGHGPFELEIMVDRRTGEAWSLDLNPRGFGQMSLTVDRGNDLPGLWVEKTTGRPRAPVGVGQATLWRQWPNNGLSSLHLKLRRRPVSDTSGRTVGAVYRRDDPLPGLASGLTELRHPRALVRPFWRDAESVRRRNA
jgi:D-aspartate ligase